MLKINLCKTYAKSGSPSDIPPLLLKLFNALKSIPPTSVDCERAFSITGQYATKLRTSLNDETLDSLVFLKASQNKLPKAISIAKHEIKIVHSTHQLLYI